MTKLNINDLSDDAAFSVRKIIETLGRMGDKVVVYDGDRIIGTVIHGEPDVYDDELPQGVEPEIPLKPGETIYTILDDFAKEVEEGLEEEIADGEK